MSFLDGMRENRAATAASHEDPGLRGRTYAIPFERVWTAAMKLAGGRLRGWRLLRWDDTTGVIQAEWSPRFWGSEADVILRVALDRDAQTRVDMTTSSRSDRGDMGASRRRIEAFFSALDEELGATPSQVLVPGGGGASRPSSSPSVTR